MSIALFACGGTGVNIGKIIDRQDIDTSVYYIDTSTSNLKDVSSSHVYIVEDMDGAGKHRATTYDKFKDVSSDILIHFTPSNKLNIVVSSLSGGSGSIIAPLVAKELIKNGYNTIVIGIDSRGSIIELKNTQKTLLTYRSISSTENKPVALFYVENLDRKKADDEAIAFVKLMTVITDTRIVQEFDISDLTNFINFDKVSDNSPSVALLEIAKNEPSTETKGTAIVTTILIGKDKNVGICDPIPEYLAQCVITDNMFDQDNIRIDAVLGKLSQVVGNIDSKIKALEDNKKVNRHKDVEANGNSDGIVL
jgi:hypothetical protein